MRKYLKYLIALILLVVFSSISFAGTQTASGLTGTNIISAARYKLEGPSVISTFTSSTQTISTLTGTNIMSLARYKLGAISASSITDPFYSDTEMIRWVNDGIYDIAKKTKCLQTIEVETLVANTVEYTLTGLYFEITGVILNKAGGIKVGLKKGSIWDVGNTANDSQTAASRVPEYYYVFAGKVGVYPAYSAVTTETIDVYQIIVPAIIVAASTVPIPAQFDKALVLYVEAQGHKKAGNINTYNAAMEEYLTELGIDKTGTETTNQSQTKIYYSDTEMIRWVNDGIYDIAKKTKCLQTIEVETLVANTIEYALSGLYFEIVGVVLNKADGTKVGLTKGNIWSVGQTQSDFLPVAQRVPLFWYEFGGKVGVYPPYSTVTTETISVYQSIIPAVIVAATAIPIPGMYDKALILYVEAQGHKKAGNINTYNAAMEEYLTELGIDKTNIAPAVKEQEVIE